MNRVYSFPYLQPQQTLSAPITEWESDLADAIEVVFNQGHHELEDLVAALNRSRVRPPMGGAWTPDNFQTVIRELGAMQ
jgi:hypothetical protein